MTADEWGDGSHPADLERAVRALMAGQVVAIPTDTVYGLAVDPRLPGATARLFALKGRPEQVALPVLMAEPAELDELAEPTPAARRLVSRYWPGPLTLVLRRRAGLAFELGGDPATIGVRCPAHELVRALLRLSGPLAVTSANSHGRAPLHSAAQVRSHFPAGLGAVLDGGYCGGEPSTVVSLVGRTPRCLREGALGFAGLTEFLKGAGPG